MKRFLLIFTALSCVSVVFAQYTNVLDNATTQTVDSVWSTSAITVGNTTSNNVMEIVAGGSVSSASGSIGATAGASNNSVNQDFGSTWINSADLWVGHGGSSNHLFVGGASTNWVGGSAYIGNTNTTANYAEIQGSNSLWDIQRDLVIGGISNGVNNYLKIEDTAEVAVGGNMNVYSNSSVVGEGIIQLGGAGSILSFYGDNISVDRGIVFNGNSSTVAVNEGTFLVEGSVSNQYRNFQSLELTDSRLEGFGALEASTFTNVALTGGTINPHGAGSVYGTLEIDGNLTLNGGTLYTAQVSREGHDLLVINTNVSLSMLDLAVVVSTADADTNIPILMVDTNGAGFSGSFNSTNIVDHMLLYNSALVVDDAGIASILTTNTTDKFSSALTLAGTEGIRAGFGGMKNSVFTRTKQLRRNLVSTAHTMPQETPFLSSTNAPSGARGFGDQNIIPEMHVWMQYFSGQGTFDAQGNSYGFDLNNNGMTLGADRLFGEALTLGFNYTYARSATTAENQDHLDTETYWLGLYGEWVGKSGFYADALAAYGFSNYDSVRREDNYNGAASYRGRDLGAYADVGQHFYYKTLSLSPYAGLHVLTTMAEEHTETEQTGGDELWVDEFRRSWVESALGLKARHRFDTRIGRFQTTGYAEWLHDFVQRDVYATLSANGLPPVDMARISPDADVVNAGLGLSWICTDYLELGVGYNGRFSERYEEHTGSLMFDVRF